MGGGPSKEELEHKEYMERKRLDRQKEENEHKERMKAMDVAQDAVSAYKESVSTAEVYTADGNAYKGLPALKHTLGEERTMRMVHNYSAVLDRAANQRMISN